MTKRRQNDTNAVDCQAPRALPLSQTEIIPAGQMGYILRKLSQTEVAPAGKMGGRYLL